MNPASGNFLVLYPRNPQWAPETLDTISQALRSTGLTGQEREPFLFSAGPEYLNLVTYLGCSPQIVLGENDGATLIRITGISSTTKFARGDNLKPPRCLKCRKNIEMPVFSDNPDEKLKCCHCGFSGSKHEFDWRRTAAFGRIFIEISNVFESEAVPGEELADCLLKATGENWDYCYIRRA